MNNNLTPEEHNRYSRQILLPEIGLQGQTILKNSSVLIIGMGGLGCPVLQYLSAMGVGKIGIVDFDKVDTSNLHRQIIYTNNDIGLPKVIAAKSRIKQTNPCCNIISIEKKIIKENAVEIISDYDLIIDGTDNFSARYIINDACVILRKPIVFGAIHQFEGQISVFNYKNGPTYRCLFPEPSQLKSCDESGVLGILPGIIGCLMANETIKTLQNFGNILSGKLLIFDSKSLYSRIISFSCNPKNKIITEIGLDSSLENESEIEIDSIDLSDEKYLLIDVRDPSEHQIFNIGGINIPLNMLHTEIKKISEISEKIIVFYCKTGFRSKEAVSIAQRIGFTNVCTIKGGINHKINL